MPRGMTDDVSNVIVQALARGQSREQIADVVGVSRRAITRVSTNIKRHGSARAPSTGAKQGRPPKMTRPQAEAMLVWIKDRNYTFYVKDLVNFLREHYGYKGCDGTVRRELVRAGFRRKLPWHKSEITTWEPPSGPPDISHTLKEPPAKRTGLTNGRRQRQTAQDQATQAMAHSIDPGLELLSQSVGRTQAGPHQAHPQQSHTPNATSEPQPFGLPHQSILQQPLPPYHPPQQPAPRPPQQPAHTPHPASASATPISNPNAPSTTVPPATAEGPREPRKSRNGDLVGQLASLQGEVARQQELIAQLQQQLQSAQPQQSSPPLQASGGANRAQGEAQAGGGLPSSGVPTAQGQNGGDS